ncbi:hypothetical protein [Streptomyces sp. NPDC001137]|uniref:hypothetical protein n=1 Tax=Streptomyces sp. NPDC001137 TaxID=3154378 RepID=UPI0033231D72
MFGVGLPLRYRCLVRVVDNEIALDRRAFAYWVISPHGWTVAPGQYRIQLADDAHDVIAATTLNLPSDKLVRPLTLSSPMGDWFGHPVVGPALISAIACGLAEGEATAGIAEALRLLSSMAMRQCLGFPPDSFRRSCCRS